MAILTNVVRMAMKMRADTCNWPKKNKKLKKKCGLVFKNKKACEDLKNLEIQMGKILSESPELRTAGADSLDEKIQMAKPDKKHRQPTSENDPNEAEDCDNCG
jgi:hypothetical protein